MNKETFNDLDISEQIDYINKNLKEGSTITNICKSIGVGRSTVRDRFEKAGYKYNNEVKQYQSYIEIVDHESSNSVVEAFDVVEDSNKLSVKKDDITCLEITTLASDEWLVKYKTFDFVGIILGNYTYYNYGNEYLIYKNDFYIISINSK